MSHTRRYQDQEPSTAGKHKRRLYRANRSAKCAGKRCFSDEIAARVGGELSIAERGNVKQLWVYKCSHCKAWHLTSIERGARWAVLQKKAA